jgi:anthranilate phosphoribosyltransferase
MKGLIEKLHAGIDLSPEDISYSVAVLLSSTASDDLKAQFLTALHQKGESAEEIAGFVRQLVDRAIDPGLEPEKLPGPMIDVCGTGGDGLDLFNVSTTIMFILAAGGAIVVKHGNRAVTSRCGSADVLEELGVAIDLAPDDLRECVERHGFGFIFARQYHPAFRAIAEMRARLARQNTRTIFNLLGPLLNPARPARQLIGVFAPRLTTVFGEVLRQLGHKRAWVVHGLGEDGIGMDDISISGATTVTELVDGKISSAVLDVNWLGIARASVAELRGGDVRENAATLEGILAGKITGPKRDMVVANAGGGFAAAGVASDLKDGIQLAREELDSGRALEKLRALQSYKPRRS